MGKKLIIKGADFSAHPVATGSWVIDGRENESRVDSIAKAQVGSFIPNDYAVLQGKIITKIRLIPAVVGNISVMKGSSTSDSNAVVVETLVVTDAMLNIPTEFNVNIAVGVNDIIGISKSTDTGNFKYVGQQIGTAGSDFLYFCFRSGQGHEPSRPETAERLTISFYCEK